MNATKLHAIPLIFKVNKLKKITLGLLLLALSAGANAGFYSANKLKQMADADTREDLGNGVAGDSRNAAQLMGYIVAVADMADGLAICLPSGTTVGQLLDITKNYINANPKERNKAGSFVVLNALTEAYPCKK